MNTKSLKTLEFDKITERLAGKAVSRLGKDRCFALSPLDDLDDIRRKQAETTQSAAFVCKKGSLPLGGIKDISEAVKRAAAGGVLSPLELLEVGEFLRVSRKVIVYSEDTHHESLRENYPNLADYFETLTESPKLSTEINRCILNETDIADDASAKLRQVRRDINITNGRVREQLNSIIRSQTYKNMLQDAVVTLRNGRYCVPVKSEFKNEFNGFVHDQSSSGATMFVEPAAVVTLNNKIRELELEEKKEIEVILRNLSEMVAESRVILETNIEALTELDFIFAKAEFSLSMRGTEPVFNGKRYINIKKGRHPLLNPSMVVPTDIYIGKDFHILLITGPNTGGKTVSLKTLGLLTLMGQSGLHIPAADGSELSVFLDVFADIGDEQSIEQSLSTFSGHMSNITEILSKVNEYCLVLLDELGAGTDPTEGAVLAAAIIDFLRTKGVRTAVTTHYSELKIYALSTDEAENAACEFDVETLSPTYRLLIGIPGKSNAFAISRRLGLPETIIGAARERLTHSDERFEDVITDLEISKKTVALEQERAEAYRRDAEKLKRDYESQKEKLSKQREKIISEAKTEARRVLEQAKNESDAIIKEMRKVSAENADIKKLEEKRGLLRAKSAEIVTENDKKEQIIRKIDRKLKTGDRVFIHSLSQSGKVLSLEANGEVFVQAGEMKIKVKISNLSLDDTPEKTEKIATVNIHAAKVGKALNISKDVDLRGLMVDEALEKLDKYIDAAYLARLTRIEIIHGKGTGALRAAVGDYLKYRSYVKSFRLGEHGEGDTGVTIAELE